MRFDGESARLAEVEAQRDAHARSLADVAKTSLGKLALRWMRVARAHGHQAKWLARPIDAVMFLVRALPIAYLRASPLFDEGWYTATYPDATRFGDPWRHFVRQGLANGHRPNLYFDPRWYIDHNPDIRHWRKDPLGHYLKVGGLEGRDPGPDFDSDWYLAVNPDVAATGMNPLVHYLTWGAREGRVPTSDIAVLFDPDWYLAQYPDVAASGLDPLSHYRRLGARDGRAPNPVFDVLTYRYDHPDVADHGDDVLLHYVRLGREQGATPHPLFDPVWYRHHHHDVGERDPYDHYLRVGRPEGRAPSAAVPEGTDIAVTRVSLPQAPAGQARVTIIVPAFRQAAMTVRCLDAIARHTPNHASIRVLLADDDPHQPLGPLLHSVTGLEMVVNPESLGFLRNCNAAAMRGESEYFVFLNTDAIVLEGWIDALLEAATRDEQVGLVGARHVDSSGRLQEAGVVMFRDAWGYPFGRGDDPDAPAYGYLREVDAVTRAGFLVRRSAWEALGGFDEAYAPDFFGEYDLAFRLAAAGWRVVYQPAANILHSGSASDGTELRDGPSRANHARFVARWADELATRYEDPADLFLARQRPSSRGIVLVVEDMVPAYDQNAGALTVFQYLRLLAEEDFRVVFLPENRLAPEPYTSALQRLGIEVLVGDLDTAGWYAEHGVHLDWVIVARPHIAALHLHHIRRRSRARVLYYTHDVHSLRERRRFEVTGDVRALAESQRLLELEQDIFRHVDCVLTPSADEVAVIRRLAPDTEIRVITPYFWSAEPPALLPLPPLATRREIVFLGGYDHPPNVDAAIVLVLEVMPLVWERVSDAKVALVGGNVPPEVALLAGERVEVAGHVPDLATVWARARVSVSPLRYGAGVKGKIVEALRAGVPVVTTSVGNEGIALNDGVEALIGDTPASLAAHVIHLLEDPDAAVALAKAGGRVFRERFARERALADILGALGPAIGHIRSDSITRVDQARSASEKPTHVSKRT
jgi:GT2 family glycosyltransferase/glycosyltransferase involved in cell wall biosynthesis